MIRAPLLSQRLANILASRGKVADFTRDCICVDDSDGLPPRLAFWDESKLGPCPTQEEVDAASDQPLPVVPSAFDLFVAALRERPDVIEKIKADYGL